MRCIVINSMHPVFCVRYYDRENEVTFGHSLRQRRRSWENHLEALRTERDMSEVTCVLCNNEPIQGNANWPLLGIWFEIGWPGQADKVLSFPSQGVRETEFSCGPQGSASWWTCPSSSSFVECGQSWR